MTCPLFQDYTRTCLTSFPEMVKYTNYDICTSDTYTDCLHYIVLNSEKKCKYIKKCVNFFHKEQPDLLSKIFTEEKMFSTIKDITLNYCLTEDKCKTCSTYKAFESGKETPPLLFPDGKTHFLDILLRKEIKIE